MKQCLSGYLKAVLDSECAELTIKTMVKLIRETKVKFDTIVFRGMSGALIAPIVARKLKKDLLMIRKENDGSHSGYTVEGRICARRYIIIDDMICSGDTMHKILNEIGKFSYYDTNGQLLPIPECVGIFLYRAFEQDGRFSHNENSYPTYSFHLDHERKYVEYYRGYRKPPPNENPNTDTVPANLNLTI